MPTPVSPIYGIQLLESAQSQPEVPLNTETRILEAMCSLSVKSRILTVPPAVVDGDCYIIPGGASGAWLGQDERVAIGANGGWLIVTAKPGQQAYVQNEDLYAKYVGTGSPIGWVNA